MGETLSQDDLNALMGELSELEFEAAPLEESKPSETWSNGESGALSQDDLNALMGELSELEFEAAPLEESKPSEGIEDKGKSESLSQDEIDALLALHGK